MLHRICATTIARRWASTEARWLLPAACLLAGCTREQSAVDPGGPQSQQIARLFWAMTSAGSLIFAFVIALLAFALWRSRGSDAPHPLSWQQSRRLVLLAGVVVPGLVLVAFVYASARVDRAGLPAGADEAMTIEVVGHQWWWEVNYLDRDGQPVAATANEIHLPVGQPVRLLLRSSGVIHSFWVPNLNGKTDLIPGKTNTAWLEAAQPGVYRGQCAEFCGLQHAHMAFMVVAVEPERFERWLARQSQPAAPPSDARRRFGQQVFLQRQCVLCHTVRGTPAGGRLGPDLTHLASRRTLAAGSLPNDRFHLARWLILTQTVKPGNLMPATILPPEEFEALLDYLGGLE